MIVFDFLVAFVIFIGLLGVFTSGEKKKTFIVDGIREVE